MVDLYNISFKKTSLIIILKITVFSDDFLIVLHGIINIIKRIIAVHLFWVLKLMESLTLVFLPISFFENYSQDL